MTYLGALSHGAHTIVINRDGRLIHWQAWTPDRQPPRHGTPAQAEDAIEAWIQTFNDWRVRAELRRDALDLRAAITRKEGT